MNKNKNQGNKKKKSNRKSLNFKERNRYKSVKIIESLELFSSKINNLPNLLQL